MVPFVLLFILCFSQQVHAEEGNAIYPYLRRPSTECVKSIETNTRKVFECSAGSAFVGLRIDLMDSHFPYIGVERRQEDPGEPARKAG